jgi:uncharacterized phage protein (TIGR01671 family)
MNRDIEFRGKRKRDGKWVYGFYYKSLGEHIILGWDFSDSDEQRLNEVYPETVGQYTSLKDKKGVKIFEGDILCYTSGNPFDPDIDIYPVVYKNGGFKFGDEYLDVVLDDPSGFEVIGNVIYDGDLLNDCK